MKRDMDFVRNILLEVEAKDDGRAMVYELASLSEVKSHHVNLLLQAGLLAEVGAVRSTQKKKVHLSWEGHDYLDAVKNEHIWQKTKAAVAEEGGSMAIELVKSLAVAFGKKQIEERTGIKL